MSRISDKASDLGRGRAVPGPSAGDAGKAPHASHSALLALSVVLVSVTAGIRFLLENATIGRIDQQAVTGVAALLASGLLLLVYSARRTDRSPTISLPRTLALGLAGSISLAAAPWAVLAHRHSDAPAGTIVLFWAVALPGAVLLSSPIRKASWAYARPAAALLAMTGAAGVLANWERPSSFSLLVRYSSEQLWIALASVALAASVAYVGHMVRDKGWPRVAVPVAVGGAAAGAGLLLWGLSDGVAPLAQPVLWMHAATFAVAAVLVLGLAATDPALAGGSLLLVPVLLSGVTFVEAAVGVLGPRPVLLDAVGWASLVTVSAIALAMAPRGRAGTMVSARRLVWVGRALAVLVVALAVVAMFAPGVDVAVRGTRTEGAAFKADFAMAGFETVGAWLVLGMGAVLAALWFSVRTSRARAVLAAVSVFASAGAWYILKAIPLHTWVAWIPSDVQQDYGTEYASIVFSQIPVPWQSAGVVLAAGAALLLGALAWRHPGTGSAEGIDPIRESESP